MKVLEPGQAQHIVEDRVIVRPDLRVHAVVEHNSQVGKVRQHVAKIFRILTVNESVDHQVLVGRFLPQVAHAPIVDPSAPARNTAHAFDSVFAPVKGQKLRASFARLKLRITPTFSPVIRR